MSIIKKTFISFFLFCSFISIGQNCATILSVISMDGNTEYYRYTINPNGSITKTGCAPIFTLVRVKLTSDCSGGGNCPNLYFLSGDFNGNYDAYEYSISNTEVVTTFEVPYNATAATVSTAEVLPCGGGQLGIPISFCLSNQGSCNINYSINTCCDLSCIKFVRTSNLATCKKCYCAKIEFTDGTTTSFYVNFGSGNVVMNCFSKPIKRLVSLTASTNCGGCATGTTYRQGEKPEESINDNEEVYAVEIERISVSPNPTKSILNFKGENLDKYVITIYNENGEIVIKNSKVDTVLSLENFKQGIYFYQLTDDSGYSQKGKIIKE